jgi:hypothetical protein
MQTVRSSRRQTMNLIVGFYLIGAGTTFAVVHGAYPLWATAIICACWPIAALGGILLHDEDSHG